MLNGSSTARLIKLIPSRLQLKWAESTTNKSTDIEGVIKFIGEQIDAAERYNRIKGVEKAKSSPAPHKHQKPFSPPPATASQLAVGAKSSPAPQVKSALKQSKTVNFRPSWTVCERPCIFCGQIHWPTSCQKTLAERKIIIHNLRNCVNCFGGKHELKDCTSIRNCNKCGGRHHTALCDKGDVRVSKSTSSASIVAGNSVSTTTACASSFGQLMLKTATVIVSGPDGTESRAILFADDGSHRSWVLKSLSSQLKLKTVAVENISTRVFKKKEASQPEMTKNVEMQVRGTWKGAPKVTLIALESDHIADTGPYVGSEFARSLWIQNEKMADDRFEMAHEEEEPIGILIGMDQMFQIMSNEAAIQSPCGLRAFKTKLGRMIAGPSQETKSKMGNKVIQQLILTSNYPVPQITWAFTASSQSNGKINSNQPIEIPTEKETGTASLQHPQIGASFSDAPTGSSGKTDSKRFKNDELNATNFDLSLFWKLENFANLDGAEAVESEDRFDSFDEKITRLPDGRYHTNPLVNG